MRSGIGPKDQLKQSCLPIVKDVPGIGQGLRDHMFTPLVYTRKEVDTARAPFYGDPKAMDKALEQWRRDGTGPWTKFCSHDRTWPLPSKFNTHIHGHSQSIENHIDKSLIDLSDNCRSI
ncbi:hypothetical protein QSH57_004799 [Fusarium oxysporum f. sp. vasinfectum]|nr:hypothetical protein QSH57_004799 [Fusarium oxysporum f. sp. vasinfectum]